MRLRRRGRPGNSTRWPNHCLGRLSISPLDYCLGPRSALCSNKLCGSALVPRSDLCFSQRPHWHALRVTNTRFLVRRSAFCGNALVARSNL